MLLKHVFAKVDAPVACRLFADQAATKFARLACDRTRPAVLQLVVLAEEVADLTRANANVTGWHIDVLANVTLQFGHHCVTEAHNFTAATTPRVER